MEYSEDAPLSLSYLKRWVSESTYKWLVVADIEAEELKQELDDNATASATNLFGNDEDEEETRIHSWSTSAVNPDGAYDDAVEDGAVSIVYILSSSLAGFGDTVWSSSRHISNLLARPDSCREILSHFYSQREQDEDSGKHPLSGVSFLELGAGAGVPSWTAMGCGARVVCTDQPNADRIRCIAECLERNLYNMKQNSRSTGIYDKCQACPYGWGTPVDEVTKALSKDGEERFDVIIAADCMYMPWLHKELLTSIDMLLSDRGVALMPFALHGNTDDDEVMKIVDRAKDKGFEVEMLAEAQLTPPSEGMEAKQVSQ
jgi:predicted nicotinamide N-methyase